MDGERGDETEAEERELEVPRGVPAQGIADAQGDFLVPPEKGGFADIKEKRVSGAGKEVVPAL